MELKEMAINAWGLEDTRTTEVIKLVDSGEIGLAIALISTAQPIQW